MSARIQVIFYSMYGHVYQMAEAVAAGARKAAAGEVSLWQVPELVPDDILEKSGAAENRARHCLDDGLHALVVEEGVVHSRKITEVRDLGTEVEVSDGVKPGDQVVLSPPVDLEDGSKIRVRATSTAKSS